jgi:hypothetical protein
MHTENQLPSLLVIAFLVPVVGQPIIKSLQPNVQVELGYDNMYRFILMSMIFESYMFV